LSFGASCGQRRDTMTDEAQQLGPESTSAELAELRKRVWRLDDRLFMVREAPVQTPFTIDVMFDRLEELTAGLDRFAYVVDLTGIKRPDARTRERLRERVLRINARLVHVGVAVGPSAVIRAVAKLAAFAIGFRSFTFHESVPEATEACRRALR
jgi:hypothetical protein